MKHLSIEERSASLRVSGRTRRGIRRELESHLREACQELEHRGMDADNAARESLRRLGQLDALAEIFAHVHRRSRRKTVALAALLSTGLTLGVFGASGTFASPSSAHVTTPVHSHQACSLTGRALGRDVTGQAVCARRTGRGTPASGNATHRGTTEHK